MLFLRKYVPSSVFLYGKGIRNKSRGCFKLHPRSTTGTKKINPNKIVKFNEARSIFTTSPLLAVYHYSALTGNEWDQVRYQLDDKGVRIKVLNSRITRKAIKGTSYEVMSPLFIGSTAIAYSRDSNCLQDVLKAAKKEPKLLLLGGLVENQLFTPAGLNKISKLPSKMVLQQELIGTLQLAVSRLCNILTVTPLRLVQLLDHSVVNSSDDCTNK